MVGTFVNVCEVEREVLDRPVTGILEHERWLIKCVL